MADDTLLFLRRLESIAALAALKGWIDEQAQMFVMDFDTGGYRSQRVFARVAPEGPNGKPMIKIQSPARVVKHRWGRGLSRRDANDLLRRNEGVAIARFGVIEGAAATMVMVSADLVLETLDAEELRLTAYAVAHTADRYEAQCGGDEY